MSEPSEKKKGFSTAYGGEKTSHTVSTPASDHSGNGGSFSLSNHSGSRKHTNSGAASVSPDSAEHTEFGKDAVASAKPVTEYHTKPVSADIPQSREYKATWDHENIEDAVSHGYDSKQILSDISRPIEKLKNTVSGKASNDTNNINRALCIMAIAASVVAILSCVLPLVTINLFGFKESVSIMQGISEGLLSGSAWIFPACCILSMIFSVVSLKNYRAMYGTIISSAIGMVMLVIQMNARVDSLGIRLADYAGSGYHLYILSSLFAILLSGIVIAQANGWIKKK